MAAVVAVAAGCARDEAALVDHDAWVAVDPADDPFDDRPDDVDCARLAWTVETLGDAPSLEVDTTSCDYLAVGQPTIADAAVGETVEVRLWHDELVAADPAETHVALAVDGAVVWETRLPVPAGEPREGAMVIATRELDEPIAEGAAVVFHLHNHGENSYNLVHFRRLAPE